MKYHILLTHDITNDTSFYSKLYSNRSQAFLHMIGNLLENDEKLGDLLGKTEEELYTIGCARNLVMEIMEFEVYDPKYVIVLATKK